MHIILYWSQLECINSCTLNIFQYYLRGGLTSVMAQVARTLRAAIRSLTSPMRSFGSAQPLQEAALEERCILVDESDKPLGDATKRDCHIVNSDGQVLLHRAFSVFLFNGKGELLLQKRSPNKVCTSCICRSQKKNIISAFLLISHLNVTL